jgi:hypothetical protein
MSQTNALNRSGIGEVHPSGYRACIPPDVVAPVGRVVGWFQAHQGAPLLSTSLQSWRVKQSKEDEEAIVAMITRGAV